MNRFLNYVSASFSSLPAPVETVEEMPATEGMSLLEILCQKLVIVEPQTTKEARHKLKLVTEHRDEFPSKLGGFIHFAAECLSKEPPETILEEIYLGVKEFFLGLVGLELIAGRMLVYEDPVTEEDARRMLNLFTKHLEIFPLELGAVIRRYSGFLSDPQQPPETALEVIHGIQSSVKIFFLGRNFNLSKREWHGLDKSIDTHDQAEVAIRSFPSVLSESRDDRSPTCSLTFSPQAVSFVPLFLHLGRCELREPGMQSILHQVPHNFSNVYMRQIQPRLLCNNSWNRDGIQTFCAELDQESLLALIHLKDMDLMHPDDLFSLLDFLFVFWNSTNYYFDNYVNEEEIAYVVAYFQKRFKLMLDWGPFLLREYRMNSFWVSFSDFDTKHDDIAEPVIRTVCKAGISHFPLELGFIFGQEYFHNGMRPDRLARRQKAKKKIFEIAREEITKALRQNKAVIKQWVYAVAINDQIPPDGLYTLIRCDPIGALIPNSS